MRAEEEAGRARDQLSATQTDIVTAVGAVQKVDVALADIMSGVGEVNTLLGNIASDNQTQSTAISQISAAISTMDHATQQNAAMVEETSAAARNLASEVSGLSDKAGQFNVGNAGASAGGGRRKPSSRFSGPTKQLPAAAVSALVRQSSASDDWQAF
jgi:methyl-accepting chemotaxis protein